MQLAIRLQSYCSGRTFLEFFSTYELKEDIGTARLISVKSFAPGFMAWHGQRRNLSPPYDRRFLLWHFEVLQFHGGFPSKTRLHYFSPKDFEDSKYSFAPPEDFRPVIPCDPFYVEDYRYTAELDVNEGLNLQEVSGFLIHKLKNKQ